MSRYCFTQLDIDRALFAASNAPNSGPAVFALLQIGANPNAEFNEGSGIMSALHVASRQSLRHVELLLDGGADARKHAAMNLSLARDPGVRARLLDAGADVNQTNSLGFTALMIAAVHNPSAVSDLLKCGASSSLTCPSGKTAAELCNNARTKALLEAHEHAERSAQALEATLRAPAAAVSERPRL